MMLSATEKNIKDTARVFFIDFGLVEGRRVGGNDSPVNTYFEKKTVFAEIRKI
jgi:hypothetical protein